MPYPKDTACAKCKACGAKFTYTHSNKSGKYCSNACYRGDKAFLKEQLTKARKAQIENGINAPKVSDELLLQLWEQFKASTASMRSIFGKHGYKRVPPKQLIKLIGKEEYDKYKRRNHSRGRAHGYLFKRGSHYERKAKIELEELGYLVVKSGGSKGKFDLWALGDGRLRLIQVKATKSSANHTSLKEEIAAFEVPPFCNTELWIWEDRKGWKKSVCR